MLAANRNLNSRKFSKIYVEDKYNPLTYNLDAKLLKKFCRHFSLTRIHKILLENIAYLMAFQLYSQKSDKKFSFID